MHASFTTCLHCGPHLFTPFSHNGNWKQLDIYHHFTASKHFQIFSFFFFFLNQTIHIISVTVTSGLNHNYWSRLCLIISVCCLLAKFPLFGKENNANSILAFNSFLKVNGKSLLGGGLFYKYFVNVNVIFEFKKRDVHPFETDTKGTYSSSPTFLLTGYLAKGVLTKLLDSKAGNSHTFTSSGKCWILLKACIFLLFVKGR